MKPSIYKQAISRLILCGIVVSGHAQADPSNKMHAIVGSVLHEAPCLNLEEFNIPFATVTVSAKMFVRSDSVETSCGMEDVVDTESNNYRLLVNNLGECKNQNEYRIYAKSRLFEHWRQRNEPLNVNISTGDETDADTIEMICNKLGAKQRRALRKRGLEMLGGESPQVEYASLVLAESARDAGAGFRNGLLKRIYEISGDPDVFRIVQASTGVPPNQEQQQMLANLESSKQEEGVQLAGASDSETILEQQRKIAMLEHELRDVERELAAASSSLESARMMSAATTASAGFDLFPPNPQPGECYARVIIPEVFKTTTERVLKREASERIEIVPARYEVASERILVKPASTRLVEVPAVYKTVTERILDRPAHTEWKRASGIGSGGESGPDVGGAAAQVERFGDLNVVATRVEDTGEVLCLVEIPATYKTITKQVLVEPATVRVIEVPAEYKTIETLRLVEPASERRIPVPAEFTTVTSTEVIAEENLQWRPVLCEVNMTAENISALQAALQKTGCCKCGADKNQCQADGIMGPCTLQAARCYANQNGLPSGEKYITMEIIRALGLEF